jgi:hypothetical protein
MNLPPVNDIIWSDNVFSGDKKVGEIVVYASYGMRYIMLVKRVNAETGKLRVPSGWATDQPHLSELMIKAADWDIDPDTAQILLIENSDTSRNGQMWLTNIDKFLKHGIPIERGFGHQLALVDEHWEALGEKDNQKDDYQLGFDLDK